MPSTKHSLCDVVGYNHINLWYIIMKVNLVKEETICVYDSVVYVCMLYLYVHI